MDVEVERGAVVVVETEVELEVGTKVEVEVEVGGTGMASAVDAVAAIPARARIETASTRPALRTRARRESWGTPTELMEEPSDDRTLTL